MALLVLALLVASQVTQHACRAAPRPTSDVDPPLAGPTGDAPSEAHIARSPPLRDRSAETYWTPRAPHKTYYPSDGKIWKKFPKKKHLVEIVPLETSLMKSKGKKLAYILPNPDIGNTKAHGLGFDSSEENYNAHLRESNSSEDEERVQIDQNELRARIQSKDSDEMIRNKIDDLVNFFRNKHKNYNYSPIRNNLNGDYISDHDILPKKRQKENITPNVVSSNKYHATQSIKKNIIEKEGKPKISVETHQSHHHRDLIPTKVEHIHRFNVEQNHAIADKKKAYLSHYIPINSHSEENQREEKSTYKTNNIKDGTKQNIRNRTKETSSYSSSSDEDNESKLIESDDIENSFIIVSQELSPHINVDKSDSTYIVDASNESSESDDIQNEDSSSESISSSNIESESVSNFNSAVSESLEVKQSMDNLESFDGDVFSPAVYVSSLPEFDVGAEMFNYFNDDLPESDSNALLIEELNHLSIGPREKIKLNEYEHAHSIPDPHKQIQVNQNTLNRGNPTRHEQSDEFSQYIYNDQYEHQEHKHANHKSDFNYEHNHILNSIEQPNIPTLEDQAIGFKDDVYDVILESREENPQLEFNKRPDVQGLHIHVIKPHDYVSDVTDPDIQSHHNNLDSHKQSDKTLETIDLSPLISQKKLKSDCISYKQKTDSSACGNKSYKLTFLFNR